MFTLSKDQFTYTPPQPVPLYEEEVSSDISFEVSTSCVVFLPVWGAVDYRFLEDQKDINQLWFWSPQWQEGEKIADEDIKKNRLGPILSSKEDIEKHFGNL